MITIFLTILLTIQCTPCQKLNDYNCSLREDCTGQECVHYFVVWEELKREMIFEYPQKGDEIKKSLGQCFPERVFEEMGIFLELWNKDLGEYFQLNNDFAIPNNTKINIKEIPYMTVAEAGLYSNPNITYPKTITTIKTEEDLHNKLLENYNKYFWPWIKMKNPCFVQTDIRFNKIINVDLQHGSLSMLVWFRLRWNDPRLTWNPRDWNGAKIVHLEQEEFWHPHIEIWNGMDSINESLEPQAAYVGHQGDIFWSRRGAIKISCNMKGLDKFPYDSSQCQFEVGSWVYDSSKVMMGLFEDGYELNVTTIGENDPFAQYDIKNVTTKPYTYPPFQIYPLNLTSWPVNEYTVILHRNHAQYTYGIIVPQALLTFISFGAFWLPPSSGERIGFTITIPLAIAVYKLLMYQQLPASNDLVFATKFSFGCFLFTIFVVMESIFAAILWWRTDPYFLNPWKSLKKLFINIKEKTDWVDVVEAVDIEMTHLKIQQNSRNLSSEISRFFSSFSRPFLRNSLSQGNVDMASQSSKNLQRNLSVKNSSDQSAENFDQFADIEMQNITTFPLLNVEQARIFVKQVLDNKQYEYALKSYDRLCKTYSEKDVQNILFQLMGVVDGRDCDFAQATKDKYNEKWQELSILVDRICQFTIVPSFLVFAFVITFKVVGQ